MQDDNSFIYVYRSQAYIYLGEIWIEGTKDLHRLDNLVVDDHFYRQRNVIDSY